MQVAEEEIQANCPGDEELINSKRSPIFKHKKYLRSKFEEALSIEENSSSSNVSLLGQNKLEKVTAAVEQPVPPSPPLPDTLPMIDILKYDIEDDENKCCFIEALTEINQSEELKLNAITDPAHSEDKPSVTMCRDFVRGLCRLGAACKFEHEIILSQLHGVYTFCRNFQNTVCSLPKCKFVHATVFEKEHYYKTGYLPHHTRAHLLEYSVPVLQSPPPPPQSEVASAEQPTFYWNTPLPPPPPPPPVACTPPVAVGYNAEVAIVRSEPDNSRAQPCTSTSSQNPERSEIDEASSSARDCDAAVALPKRCNNCPIREQREQELDAKIADARRRLEEKLQQIAQIDAECELMETILSIYIKPNLAPNNNLMAKVLMSMESGLLSDAS